MTVEEFRDEVRQYLRGEHPYPFGSFVTAVLANDLVGALSTADTMSRYHLHDFAGVLYNEMPGRTGDASRDWWGSYEAVANRISEQRSIITPHAGGTDA